MIHFARYLSMSAIALGLLASPSMAAGQKVLVLLSTEGTEAQAFNLVLANQVQGTGNAVNLLLCGGAGDIALKTAPEAALKPITPNGMTVRTLLEGLIKKGGKVEVCAIYLPNRKLQADALMDGVTAAKPQDIAAIIADPAVKVMGQ